MNTPKLSYLITFRASNPQRTNIFDHILQQITSIENVEVCLVEQDSEPRLSYLVEHHNSPLFNYIFVENSGVFNKSWGLNIAAKMSTGEQLIFADADILLTASAFQNIESELGKTVDAINPYNILIDLNAQETAQLLTQQSNLDLERTSEQLNRVQLGQHIPFCGGIFAITRQLFESCGGMDERFEGWGGDDDAISMRVSSVASNAISLDEVAYHLWHGTEHQPRKVEKIYIRNLALLSMYFEHDKEFLSLLASEDFKKNACHNKYRGAEQSDLEFIDSDSLNPLVSCLCVTRDRVLELKRAIACFHAQDHPNKELCVVVEDDDQATMAFVNEIKNASIRIKVVPAIPKLTLGELRNTSIEMARGDYICQWDDDDWYHSRRLSVQLDCVMRNKKGANVLPRWLIYDQAEGQAYCSNVRLWEGSLFCKKDLLPKGQLYKTTKKGEDSALIAWLYRQDQIAIEDHPELYVYNISGDNTWGENHFQKILDASQKLTARESQVIANKIKIFD